MKYTKGQWKIEIGNRGMKIVSDNTLIARMNESFLMSPLEESEVEANANLISIAPELLEACKMLLGYKDGVLFSGTLTEIDGNHGAIKCLKEDRIYFITEGSGKFIIDNKEDTVSVDDLIFIPKNTPYNIIGKMKYFLVCSPEFNPKDDVFL